MKKIFLIIILLSMFSCGKKATVHIKAINAVTGQPYAGLTYGITATKSGLNGEKKVFEETGVLDANGEAYVTIKVKTGRTYNVGITEPPNICYINNIHYTFGKEDLPNLDFQFEYAECGYLQLKVKNISCYDANDKIFFNLKPSYTDPNYKIIQMTKLGCFDFEFIDELVPYGPWIATWQVTKNGVTSNHDSTFYIGENQHYYFNLEY